MMRIFKNPFVGITLFALIFETALLVFFYALPDPLGLSMSEMFSGKTVWQLSMAYGAILALSGFFALAKAPRALAVFDVFYFFFAIVDYEVFRFTHQRLSYSYIRTYFHPSNIFDSTTTSTLGGEAGTALYLGALFFAIVAGTVFVVFYSRWNRRRKMAGRPLRFAFGNKVAVAMIVSGLVLSTIPLWLFLAGTRGTKTVPVLNIPVDMRFTLGKHTLTAPILHIAAEETFEFVKDNYKVTDEMVRDLDAFLPGDFSDSRIDAEFPGFRKASLRPFRASHAYNIVLIFGESFKGRVFNRMLDGDTALAPNIWKFANGGFSQSGGGALWFKNAFSGSYPTVRGTMSTYLGFPSHPNRDLPSFYASNHFKGFPEYLADYRRAYVTVSNPVFDHTLPFVEKFFDEWSALENPEIPGTMDSIGVDRAIETLSKLPSDGNWFLTFNTIATHIPFYNYPESFAPKPEDDAMFRYRSAVRYTDSQLKRFFEALASRPDFERTVVILLGDHDTPVDSVDYRVPQPLGVAASQIFMGIFSADSNLIRGFSVREDVASQLDVGPTVLDLAQVREANHFWGYDLLSEERPEWQPSLFYTQNAYYLGFRDSVLTGSLDDGDVYVGKDYEFVRNADSASVSWKRRAVNASRILKSLLRNDEMMP